MQKYTLADATALNTLKNRIRDVTRLLDARSVIYPDSLEAAQVKHEVGILLSELAVHGLWPANESSTSEPGARELVNQYVAGLNMAIRAGSDMRTIIGHRSVGVLAVSVAAAEQRLKLTYIHRSSPYDQTALVPLRSSFTTMFSDYPDALRAAGWE